MRILFLSSRLPYPPDRGDRLRLFHIIKRLSQTEHKLFLISFIEKKNELEYLVELRRFCDGVKVVKLSRLSSMIKAVLGIFSHTPLQISYYKSKKMKKEIERFLLEKEINVIYVHLFRMAPYVEHRSNIYKVLDLTDVISIEIERSMKYRKGLNKKIYSLESPRLRQYEKRMAAKFDETWVISETEAKILRDLSPDAHIEIVTNGVDLDYFKPEENCEKKQRIIFVGNLQVAHNIDAVLFFYEKIFPYILQKYPEIRFYVVGADPHQKIKSLSKDHRVVVTGFVRNLNQYLNEALIFVAPLRFGAGVQNKILEAMASGLPVVCTSLANQGIKAKNEKEILIADNPIEFGNLILDLIDNADKSRLMGIAGRKFVAAKFNWDHALARFSEVEELIYSKRLLRQD
jgi:sugar transferase (PEP-CTERM/EpsH1 system associated)